jgi:tetratricopeptide (TPR) repeat protein
MVGALRRHLKDTLWELGGSCWRSGQRDRALGLFQEATEQIRIWHGADHPDTQSTMRCLTAASSISLLERNLEQQKEKLGPDHPQTLNAMRDLAAAHIEAEFPDEAVRWLEETLAKYEGAGRLNETLPLLDDLAVVCDRTAQKHLTEIVYRHAIQISTKLSAEYPANAGYREYMGHHHRLLGVLLIDFGWLAQGEQSVREALIDFERLAADFAEVPRYRSELADTHCCAGYVHVRNNRLPQAKEEYCQAFDLYDKLGLESADEGTYCESWIARQRHNDFAWLLATAADPELRDPCRAVQLAKQALERAPKGNYWNTLGVAHYGAGDWKSAIDAFNQSMQLRNGGDGFDWVFLAMAYWQSGQKDESRKWYEKAVDWIDKNQPQNAALQRFRAETKELLGVE